MFKNHPLPSVRPHPEVLDFLRLVGSGETAPEDAYQQLRMIASTYLGEDASKEHADLIGELIVYTTFPSPRVGTVLEMSRAEWQNSNENPPCALAADHAVKHLLLLIAFQLAGDATAIAGQQSILHNVARRIIPPNGYIE